MQVNWQPSFNNKDFEILTENKEYDGVVKLVSRKLSFKAFDNNQKIVMERMCVLRQSAAAVILYVPKQDVIILVEQFRVGAIGNNLSPWLLEPVAGIIESGDTAEKTAIKESMEEAGCLVLELIHIGNYLVSPGISNELTYLFCGKINDYQAGSIHGLAIENENIKVHALPVKQAFQLLDEIKILPAATFICLQWLKLNYEKVVSKWQN